MIQATEKQSKEMTLTAIYTKLKNLEVTTSEEVAINFIQIYNATSRLLPELMQEFAKIINQANELDEQTNNNHELTYAKWAVSEMIMATKSELLK